MIKLRTALAPMSLVALLLVAGCMGTRGGGAPTAAGSALVEGDWAGTDGVAVSTLQAGRFTSRTLATGEKLTEGTYTHRDQQTIDLSFYSVRSKQNTAATCLLASMDQMNCTLASGTTFILMRRPAVS